MSCADKVLEIITKINPKYKEAVWSHKIVYDSTSETLEPIYFWILDFLKDLGFNVEKIVDNFSASPGSGYFAELGARATKMQEEGIKMLGMVNTLIKSVINLIYDLKEFEIRLHQYDLEKSQKKEEQEAGILGLKQIWMDNVDIRRGRGSINMMTYELQFTTLRDAFMAAKSLEDVDKMDLNDRVKRILKPRLAEFFEWKKRSETELRKRFEIEKSYLKSQVNTLKLYTRWAKPYLRAAEQLRMKESTEPELVNAFNSIVLELCLFGKNKIDYKKEADLRNLPEHIKDIKLSRDYYACVLIDFVFRGIPSRTQQGHYVFGGRADVEFKAFALNDDEIKVLKKEMDKDDFATALSLVENVTDESLKQLTEDLEHFIGSELEEKKEEEQGEKGLFGGMFASISKSRKKEKPNEIKIEEKKSRMGFFSKKNIEPSMKNIKKDNFNESLVRLIAERTAAKLCFTVYDIYKKAHGMASFPEPEFVEKRWLEKKG